MIVKELKVQVLQSLMNTYEFNLLWGKLTQLFSIVGLKFIPTKPKSFKTDFKLKYISDLKLLYTFSPPAPNLPK